MSRPSAQLDGGGDLQPESSRRRSQKRIRTACLRCQRRKTRCDAELPSCSACIKTGAQCVYQEVRHHDASRQYVNELETRLHFLEAMVRQRCPDVDLSDDSIRTDVPETANNTIRDHDYADWQNGTPHTGQTPQTSASVPEPSRAGGLSHQVGLVSISAGVDPKYVGPSSGYFFAQSLLDASHTSHRARPNGESNQSAIRQHERELCVQLFQSASAELPATVELAHQLSETFFTSVHVQYPFLHQPSHQSLVEQVYRADNPTGLAKFHVYMVLSLSATILARRSRVELPADRWCTAALDHLGQALAHGSVEGLQSLLLLLIYSMLSPAARFDAWYINYQCIAMVLDLGLQRSVKDASLPFLQREMRRRIFWTVYSIDRKLSTMMGRPIGLRDEACDLTLPEDVSDEQLSDHTASVVKPTHMTYSIQVFKMSLIISEIKYVVHSIMRDPPSYAFPAVRNIVEWQDGISERLDMWLSNTPRSHGRLEYAAILCQILHCQTKMLLLVPSPGIPNPRLGCLQSCYENAICTVRHFHELYNRELLMYSRSTCHSVVMSAMCILYCAVSVPAIRNDIILETFMADLRTISNILSALGEHWAGVRKSRDLLDELSSKVIQQIIEARTVPSENTTTTDSPAGRRSRRQTDTVTNGATNGFSPGVQQPLWDPIATNDVFGSFLDPSVESGFGFFDGSFDVNALLSDVLMENT